MLNMEIFISTFYRRRFEFNSMKNFSNLPHLNGYETRNSFSNWFLGQRLLSNKRRWKFFKGTNDDLRYEFFYMLVVESLLMNLREKSLQRIKVFTGSSASLIIFNVRKLNFQRTIFDYPIVLYWNKKENVSIDDFIKIFRLE